MKWTENLIAALMVFAALGTMQTFGKPFANPMMRLRCSQ